MATSILGVLPCSLWSCAFDAFAFRVLRLSTVPCSGAACMLLEACCDWMTMGMLFFGVKMTDNLKSWLSRLLNFVLMVPI
jgi:hypothetical protein